MTDEMLDAMIVKAFAPFRAALKEAYQRGAYDALNPPDLPIVPGTRNTREVFAAVRSATQVADVRHIRGRRANARLTRIRQATAVILREDCCLSFPACAKLLGYGDHTTVMNAVAVSKRNPMVAALAASIRQHMGAA